MTLIHSKRKRKKGLWAEDSTTTEICNNSVQFSSVAQSCLTLRSHGLQHTRLPCPSPTPRACSNSCPSSHWCFSSHLQSLPASKSFPMSQLFASGSQSIGASASASVLPINIQDCCVFFFLLVWSPCSPRDSQESSTTPQFKSIDSLILSFLYGPTLTSIHDYWKNHSFDQIDFVSKVLSLLFSMLSRLVIAFPPWRKRVLISWLWSPSAVILEPKKINPVIVSIVSPSVYHEMMGWMPES